MNSKHPLTSGVTRRGFVKATAATGGGLAIAFHMPTAGAATMQPGTSTRPARRSTPGWSSTPTTR